MQAIPGEIKARVILISNEMPDESTDENTIQPTYKLTTCLRVISSLISGQGIRDELEEDLHTWVKVDQAKSLCHRNHLTFW